MTRGDERVHPQDGVAPPRTAEPPQGYRHSYRGSRANEWADALTRWAPPRGGLAHAHEVDSILRAVHDEELRAPIGRPAHEVDSILRAVQDITLSENTGESAGGPVRAGDGALREVSYTRVYRE